MGRSAALFFSTNADAETLHQRIIPSTEQQEEQQARWNELADTVMSGLQESTGFPVSSWLQGSYKFATQIRPVRKSDEFDIDLGLYFEWAGAPEEGGWTPKSLKNQIQNLLYDYVRDHNEAKGVVTPAKERCCRIRFDGDFHIDLPAYHLDRDRDVRHLATETKGWEASDPKAFYLHFRDRFEQARRDKIRRHVRYLKTWAALKFRDEPSRPSSVLLTTLVADAAILLTDDDLASDDTALVYLLRKINQRLAQSDVVANPADPGEDLAARLSANDLELFKDRLLEFEDIGGAAIAAGTAAEAAAEWGRPFEHMFPLPEVESGIAVERAAGQLQVVAPQIRVVASSGDYLRQGVNMIGPIPKGVDINFEITNAAQFPAGTEFEWTVRNSGREAEQLNDLGHRKVLTDRRAQETSAYNGTHFMDCAARLNGRIIALRRVPVKISGWGLPLRQKPSRRVFRITGRR